MTLKSATKALGELFEQLSRDLVKAENGNKAAAQRVRIGTIRLSKVSKDYRKLSIQNEKKELLQKNKKKSTSQPRATSKKRVARSTR